MSDVSSGRVANNSCSARVIQHASRRDRIVAAAIITAAQGYDTCQIRAVADAAGVAPSTVYRYFESKDELLLAGLLQWLDDFDVSHPVRSAALDPYDGLLERVETLTTQLASTPALADAFIRPYLGASGANVDHADQVRNRVTELFSESMIVSRPIVENGPVAELFADVWLTNIAAIAQGRTALDELVRRLTAAVAALRCHDRRRIALSPSQPAGSIPHGAAGSLGRRLSAGW